LKITPKRRSKLDNKLTLSDVVARMVDHIIENEILQPPYISCHTVNQLMWGEGAHWNNADSKTKAGILDHAGIQRPPNWYIAEQGRRFGYIMDWPPLAVRNVITGGMREHFINPILDQKAEVPYQIAWCRGYIDESSEGEAKYIPEYGQ
jgi:hypothetical protein